MLDTNYGETYHGDKFDHELEAKIQEELALQLMLEAGLSLEDLDD